MTDQSSPAVPAVDPCGALVCPVCGGSDLTLDWDAVVTVRVVDGRVEHVTVGGVLGGVAPDRFMCADCGDDPAPVPADVASAVGAGVVAAVDEVGVRELSSALTDGVSLFDRVPNVHARPLRAWTS